MRDSSQKITQLCESWWGRVADSTKVEQHRYGEELLGLLGWEQPIPFSPKEAATALSALPYLLRAGGQTTVAVYFVMPGTLERPSSVVERGLDFCEPTLALVTEAHTLNVQYVLICDLYRSYLYDVTADDLLLWADDPKIFTNEFQPVLSKTNLERGSLEELRRQPQSVVARQLREWCQHWIDALSSRGRIPEETASLALDRLLVVRYLFDHDILRRTKWRLEQRFAALVKQASGETPAGCGEELNKLFHDMWFDWKIDLFEPTPDLDRVLAADTVTGPLLREFALLSRGKFSIATILESFNHGDPAEKMRVRMVPDENEERDQYLSRQRLDTIDESRIEIDLIEEGYRAIFHWFDKVVALYERLEVDFNAKAYRQAPRGEELDLFAWSELDAHRPSACADKMAYACEHGFGIYYNSPHQHRIARLMLTLHLISRYSESRQAINHFPSLHNVLLKRPAMLPAERVMNVRPPMDAGDDLDLFGRT